VPFTIYCHTLIADGRRYVGQTKLGMARRWRAHVVASRRAKGSRFFFANVIRKYGPDAFSHDVLQVCETQEEANEAERSWIVSLRTREPALGFNQMAGGTEGPHHIERNPWDRPEHRAKMLEALNRPEATALMSEASRLAKSSPEFRAKVSAEAAARWADPEKRTVQSAAIATGKKAGYENDPTLAARIQAKRIDTLAKQRAERTHFDCKVHGRIPLADCYSKTSSSTGFTVYECRVCVLAAQKAKRDEAKAAKPPPGPRTSVRCRRHGTVPFEQCFRIVRAGRVTHRCRACNLDQQKRGRASRKATTRRR
jgi:hypothetical protein